VSEVVEGKPDVAGRAAALLAALQAGGDRLDPEAVERARAVLERTGERMLLGAEHTVVALVGATGSGKSSLFNALAEMEISEVGPRRPTTNRPMACVWDTAGADPLLDWLEIPHDRRTVRESVLDADHQARLHGLVLIDLPDHDSSDPSHRLEVDRLVQLVDLLVWVVDPQKYADQALHAGYLRRLVGHQDVMFLVLNQVDRLAPAEIETCIEDLGRLLDADGLPEVGVVATSARRGDGVEELRAVLAGVVLNRSVVLRRAEADLVTAAADLADGIADGARREEGAPARQRLVEALSAAAGVPGVLDTVEADYRRHAGESLGWPFLRVVDWLRPDPLRALHLGAAEDDVRRLTHSAPEATPAQRARVDLAVHEVVAEAADRLPARWADAVRSAASPGDDLADALDAAVSGVDLDLRPPPWWRVVSVLQLILAALAVIGFGWLAGIGLAGWLGMTTPTPPYAGGVPLPTLLLAVGLLGGLLAAGVCQVVIASGARQRRRQVADQVMAAISEVADQRVLTPVASVLEDHRLTREALAGAG